MKQLAVYSFMQDSNGKALYKCNAPLHCSTYMPQNPHQKLCQLSKKTYNYYYNMRLILHRTTTIPAISHSYLWSSVSHELSCQSSTPSTICKLVSSTTPSVPHQGSPIWTTETR